MIFQPARQTAARVATCPGGLLPHLLTLAPVKIHRILQSKIPVILTLGSHSLLCSYALADIFPFGSAAFFAVRTFLHAWSKDQKKRQGGLLLYFICTIVAPNPYSLKEASWQVTSG